MIDMLKHSPQGGRVWFSCLDTVELVNFDKSVLSAAAKGCGKRLFCESFKGRALYIQYREVPTH